MLASQRVSSLTVAVALVLTVVQFIASPTVALGVTLPAGAVSTLAGSGSATTSSGTGLAAGLQAPAGAAYAGGAVYAGGPDYVAKTDLATRVTTVFAGAPGTTGCTDGATGAASTFSGIKDLATDGTFLYSVSSCGLRKTSLATGATSAVAGTPGSVVGVAAANGLLYLTVSYYYGTVYQLDPASGALTTLASLRGCCNPSSVFGITADATYAYVLTIDYNNSGYEYGQAIQRIKLSDHAVSTLVADGSLLQSTIESVGSDLYVGAVIPGGGDGPILRRVSKADGSWGVVAGSGTGYLDGTGTDAWFATISDLASDGTNIYVADRDNNRVRQVASAEALPVSQAPAANTAVSNDVGLAKVVAGTGTAATTTGIGTAASFNTPKGVTYLNGSVYVGGADAVSRVNLATGQVTVLAGLAGGAGCTDSASGAASRVSSVQDLTNDGHYVYARACGLIRFDPATGATSKVSLSGMQGGSLVGLTVGPDRFLYGISAYAADMHIYRIDPVTGGATIWATLPNPGTADCMSAYSLTSDSTNLYALVTGITNGCYYDYNHRIQQISFVDKTVTQWPVDNTLDLSRNIESFGDSIYATTTSGALVRIPKALPTAATFASGIYANDIASDGRVFYTVSASSNQLVQLTPVPAPAARAGLYEADALSGGSNPSTLATTCSCADPVNTATGTLSETASDLSLPGRGPGIAVTRSYDSGNANRTGIFGYGWTSNNQASLRLDPNQGSGTLTTSPVVQVVQENGSTATFRRNADGTYSTASTTLATLTNNPDGSWTYARRAHVTLTFDSTGRFTRTTDLNGYHSDLAYNGSGQLTTLTDSAGRTLTFSYNTAGTVAAVTDSAGRQTIFSYDGNGNLSSVTDPAGWVTGYGYDSAHRLTDVTDPRGHTTHSAYDWQGHVTSQTDRAGRTTTFDYNPTIQPLNWTLTVTNPRRYATRFAYTDGKLISRTAAVGTPQQASWTYAYDPVSNGLTQITDPLGHTTSATYDAAGNRLSAVDGLGRGESWTYNNLNEPRTHIDRNGVTTNNTYDSAGNLLTTSTPLVGSTPTVSATTTLTYGDLTHPGDVTAATNPRGKTTSRVYDSYGQLTSSTDPLGRTSTQSYTCSPAGPGCRSNIGWVYGTVSPKGNASGGIPANFTTTLTRDDMGRVLTHTDPLARTTTTTYDNKGNLATVTDAKNHLTSYTYNNDDERTVVTRPDQTTLGTGYDDAGNVTSQTNGAGKTTSNNYDPLDRVASSNDPLNRTTSYQYDLAGRLTSTIDPANRTTSYQYDLAGRRTSVSYSDGSTPNVVYGYDSNGNRTSMTDGTGATSYTIDSLGRLTSTTNGAGRTIGYGYDLNSNRTSITYGPGQVVTRGFDDADELTSVTDWASHTSSFTYDADGHQQSTNYANGVTETTTVDRTGQVTAMADTQAGTTVASYTYTRDATGLLTSTTPTGATSQSNESYGHSTLDQLTTFTTPARSTAYGYDGADNLTALPSGTTQGFDAANQVTSSRPPISLVGTAKAGDSGTTSSLTLTLPAGTAANDQILLTATMPQSKNVTTPTGYTLVGTYTSGTTTTSARMVVFRRTSIAGDPNPVVAFGQKFAKAISLAVYRGVNPTTPIDTSTGGITATGTSVTAPAVTTTSANERLVVLDGENNSASAPAWTAPAGSTLQTTQAGGTTVSNAIADMNQPNAGSSGTKTSVLSTSASLVSALLALKPAVTSYNYNPQGSRVSVTPASGAVTTLAYDQAERLKTYGSNATYSYNGDGLRTGKAISGATTAYTWDLGSALPLLLSDGSNSWIYGPGGQLIEQISGTGTASYIHHDQQGSTRVITSQAGAVTGTYTYDPYGRTTSHTGTAALPLLYDGQYQDSETGLYYLRARYYDPATAQFLTRDPLEAITGSPYGYVNGDPLDAGDPSGLFCIGSVCAGFDPAAALVNFGRGASFGFSDKIANWISPGASCTIDQNAGYKVLGAAATLVATFGAGGAAAEGEGGGLLAGLKGRYRAARMGGSDAGSISLGGAEFSEDEIAQLTYQHIGAGDIAGRPTLDEISGALAKGEGVPIAGQNAVTYEYGGVRVIVNGDMPWRSTAYYPGR